MKREEIKIGHIYYVHFEPVRKYEFGKHHMAVVLKKNADNRTYIVMPLTSSSSGDGVNKTNLGIIDSLPEHLSDHDTYAVYDQIRTVEISRFQPLTQDGEIIEAHLPSDLFLELYVLAIKDMLRNLSTDDKIAAFYDAYKYALQIKLTDIVFALQKGEIGTEQAQSEVNMLLKTDINNILSGMPDCTSAEIIRLIDNPL